MKTRLLALVAAFLFVWAVGSSSAQFGIKKKKEDKPAETKSDSSSTASSEKTKPVVWIENAISFEVPENWQQLVMEKDMVLFSLTGPDSASISINISRLGASFPAEASLKANRDEAARKKKAGEFVSYADLTAGKARGVQWLEAEKPNADDVRRLSWVGFQKKNGWNQVTVHISSKSGAFPKHEATFNKILASLKVDE